MLGVGGASAMAGRMERLMVARRPLVWAGLGRGRACLETPGEVWGESLASHVAFLATSVTGKGGSG